jgi:ribonuclease BN (tRNA processing enzyme)
MEPEPVELTFLGSGDAFGSGGRFQACVHVRAGPTRFLIDCGASSLVAMKRLGVDPAVVEVVLLSHLHGDHFGGLPFLVLDGQFSRRARTLHVAGPPGVETRIGEAMEVLFPGSSRVTRAFALEFLELPERRETRVQDLAVTAYPVVHASGAPAFALRVTAGGKVIGYSGDTEWTESLVEAARGADVFICEAYFFEKRVKYHLDWRTVMEHRHRLDCRRLILTHMSEDMLRRLPLDGVECAEDGLTVTL